MVQWVQNTKELLRAIMLLIALSLITGFAGCLIENVESDGMKKTGSETMDVNDTPYSEEEPPSYAGGVSTVVLHGTGVLVSSDVESMTATIAMDDEPGLLSGQEVVFDFTTHTESLPVQLDMVQPGDSVTVTYFYATNAKGYMSGESLVLGNS